MKMDTKKIDIHPTVISQRSENGKKGNSIYLWVLNSKSQGGNVRVLLIYMRTREEELKKKPLFFRVCHPIVIFPQLAVFQQGVSLVFPTRSLWFMCDDVTALYTVVRFDQSGGNLKFSVHPIQIFYWLVNFNCRITNKWHFLYEIFMF